MLNNFLKKKKKKYVEQYSTLPYEYGSLYLLLKSSYSVILLQWLKAVFQIC